MKLRLLVLLVALLAPPAAAEHRSSDVPDLEIVVVDALTGDPVPYAHFVGLSPEGHLLANGSGRIRLPQISGVLRFRIEHIAYRSTGELALCAEDIRAEPGRIELEPHAHAMAPVEIRADRETTLRRSVRGGVSITPTEIASLPNPADDVFRALRALPAVTGEDLGGRFRIRGGGADETLVRIDGLELRELFHGSEFGGVAGIVPLQVVDAVEVYAGGFPAEFGGRLSGVIDVDLRRNGKPGLHGRLGAGLISSSALVELNEEKRTFLLSAREGYLGRVLGAVQDKATIDPNYRDLMLRTVLHPGPNRSVSFNYLRSEDHGFYEDRVNRHFVDTDQRQHHVWSTGRFSPLEALAVKGTVYWSQSSQSLLSGGGQRDDYRVRRAGSSLDATVFVADEHLLKVGVQVDREWGEFQFTEDDLDTSAESAIRGLDPLSGAGKFREVSLAAYAQDEWKPIPRLAINAGARLTHYSDLGDLHLNPRLSAALELPGETIARAAWGFYEQSPGIELEGDLSVRLRSGRSERAEHRIVGVERPWGGSRVGLEAYDKRFHQLNGLVTRTREGEIQPNLMTHGRAMGVEAFWNRRTQASDLRVSYTLSKSQWANDDWLFSRKFDRLHSASLSGARSFSDRWDLGLNYSYHSGLPYTAQRWIRDSDTGRWTLDEGIPNRARLPSYHRLDVRITRHFDFSNWRMSVFAEALNVTNRDNVAWYAWTFRERDGTRRPARVRKTGMPGVPAAGIEVRF